MLTLAICTYSVLLFLPHYYSVNDWSIFLNHAAEKPNERCQAVIHLSSLPIGVTVHEISDYLEAKGSNVQILSCVNLGKGNAKVEVSGFTAEGMRCNI